MKSNDGKNPWALEDDIYRGETDETKQKLLDYLYRLIKKEPYISPNALFQKALTRNADRGSPLSKENVLELTKTSYERWVDWREARRWHFKGI